MKKWFYFIVPLIGLTIFLFYYFAFAEEAQKKEVARKAEIARKVKEEDDRKKVLEEKARLDAEKKAKERADAEAAKELERVTKWSDAGKKIQDETDDANKAISELTAKIGGQEKELAELRRKKETANRNLIETARQVELAKIARRSAEIEIQRMTSFLVKKAEDTALSVPVAAPAPVAK